MKQQTALITGASSGIGKATAILLHEKGYNVYATARRLEMMEDLKAQGINVLYLDVSQEESMIDRKSTRLNSSHVSQSRMPSSA